jgi:hypothetical protein
VTRAAPSRLASARGVSVAAVVLAAVLHACDPTVFDDLRDDAPVRVVEAPGAYPRGGFGGTLTTWAATTMDGTPVARLAVGAGADTPTYVYAAWDGQGIALDPALARHCDEAGECELGAGAAMAGVPTWRGRRSCLALGAPTSSFILVRCEDMPEVIERVAGPVSSEFGAAIAALPLGYAPGELLASAPLAGAGLTGAVYRVSAAGGVVPLDLSAGTVGGVSGLGEALVAAALPGGEALLAARARTGTGRRVVVARLDAAGAATVVSCLDGPAGFGGAMALGDVDADGTPDLVLGDAADLPSRAESVALYDGAALLAAGGCPGAPPAPRVLACQEARGVACAGSGFGASLAIGDLDGDGDGDLVVGAATATVRGASQAGAVFLIPTGAGGLPDPAMADALTASTPEASARLGAAVAVFRSRGRDEVVAGAPGSDEVFVFPCSGLPGDGPEVGERCIPPASP